MTVSRRELGKLGEGLARDYLLEVGYRFVCANWRSAVGEIDLVMMDGSELVFVEVRTRRGGRLGSPEESVTLAKQAKLIELAYTYLAENSEPVLSADDPLWRIDVVAIEVDYNNQVQRLNHIPWAVSG